MEFSVEGIITRDDFAEAYAYLGEKIKEKSKKVEPPFFGFFHMLLVGLVIGLSLSGLRRFGIYSFHLDPITALVVLGLFGFVILFLMGQYRPISKNLPSENGAILGHHKYMINEKGFTEETKAFTSLTHWKGIQSVEETSNQIYIFIDTHCAHFIPKRFFLSESSSREFLKTLNNGIDTGK